ncbi:MAG TPA: AmmeMemoRadiSam system protein B [Vicinamibacterales bacterium]|nr:AmmeMemoRadiSam system protein B [Vicinamibacterales bacterium]
MAIRPAAVAGSWYPGTAGALTREVDAYLDAAPAGPDGRVVAVIAPHAGIMFSGPVAAHAYKAAARGAYDVVVLVGPSHFVGFDGVAAYSEGAFDCPLGPARIDSSVAGAIARSPIVVERPAVHRREHSLEMQLPFLKRLLPEVPIVPLLMGYQTRATVEGLATALAEGLAARRALLVGSTDLSHYFDAQTAVDLDARVLARVAAFDPDGLLGLFEQYPEEERGRFVACGGGPAIAVLMAARALGAREARVLTYAHSGQVSGDLEGVVGYMAAAIGDFTMAPA